MLFKRLRSAVLITLLLITSTILFHTVQADDGHEPPRTAVSLTIPGQLIIKFTPAAAQELTQNGAVSALSLLNTQYKVKAIEPFFKENVPTEAAYPLYILTVPNTIDLWQMATDYSQNPAVAYAEPNYRVLPTQAFTKANVDPLYSQQWSLHNTGQEGGTIDADIDWQEASIFLGNNPPIYQPVIAILDTGVDLNHVDLRAKLLQGYDFHDDDADPDDTSGHGTGTASIAAAATSNYTGMAGVCPNCNILPVRVGSSVVHFGSSAVGEGIFYAADRADVISMSLGGTCSSLWADAVNYAHSQGVVMVAAASNYTGPIVVYPAKFKRVIGVSATNHHDDFAWWSAFGSDVDLSAPGEDILVAERNNTYDLMTGTSAATPHVAGTAALLLGQNPALTSQQVRQILRNTAEDFGLPGHDWFFGYGRLNANIAIQEAQTPPSNVYNPSSDRCSWWGLLGDMLGGNQTIYLQAARQLQGTQLGTQLATFGREHQAQLTALIIANPHLGKQLVNLIEAALPSVESLANGAETAVLTPTFIAQGDQFVADVITLATPELSQDIQALWQQLKN